VVLITVGSAPQGFRRLLQAIDELAGRGAFGILPVFMQIGHVEEFTPTHCEFKRFVSREEFRQLMERASLVICHGGATSLEIIRTGKVPVVMPRRKKYGEIVNDHQVEFVQALAALGRIIPAMEPEDLPGAIVKARVYSSQPPLLPSSPMISLVSQSLEEFLR
jgi:UDP-N-acetylglucosamine transferase subunit ALG13